jgi:hypothetical protein
MGIHMEMWTRPRTIRGLLEGMKLLDFEPRFTPMREFLQAARTTPQPLKPLLMAIRDGLVQDHPAIVEFIEKAVEEEWLSAAEEIQTSLHVAYLMEAFVASMANNNDFAKELGDHVFNKRVQYGIKRNSSFSAFWNVLLVSKDLFAAVKIISVDATVTSHLHKRDNHGELFTESEVERLCKQGKLSYPANKLMMPQTNQHPEALHEGVRINIYQAGVTEYKKGFTDNAMSAHSLCESVRLDPHPEECKPGPVMPGTINNHFYQSLSDENNFLPCSDFSREWISLYESWNLAFILGELNNLHILIPKLLIPSVLSSKKEYFTTTRVFALWFSFNIALFRKLDRVRDVNGPANKIAMAKAWGEINKKYAYSLARESANQDPRSFEAGFESFFSWPALHLMKIIKSY